MIRKRLILTTVLTIPLLLLGCYPEGPDYIEDFDLVITNHDPKFDFKSKRTYALPDQVVKLTGTATNSDEVEFVAPEYADIILARIRKNMTEYEWEEVSANDNPDVILLPSATTSTYSFWYYDYWYWNWWYPYYWWGWYYPYPVYGGSVSSGTVFIQMTYPAGITAADNIPVVWTSVLNGLLEGDVDRVDDRIEDGIDRAYEQSTYLDRNKK